MKWRYWRSVIFLYFYFQRLLSILQIKAETEIREAERLISEKDAELNAAEDGLSGLKEVFKHSLVLTFPELSRFLTTATKV